jgi:hypothetical protein
LQKAEGKRDDDATSRSQKSQVQNFTIQRISASTCDSYWTKSMPVGLWCLLLAVCEVLTCLGCLEMGCHGVPLPVYVEFSHFVIYFSSQNWPFA